MRPAQEPPKVSVIMPTYNRAHYLSEAIQSVLNQTFRDFELIVVDDGSTDKTTELLKSTHDARTLCIRQEHSGISAAMNTGINASRGKYIARLDSDDIWVPQMLATQVAVLDRRSEVGLVYAMTGEMNQAGVRRSGVYGRPEFFDGESFKSMIYGDFTSNITIVVRRTCLDRVGLYDESFRVNEDWELWLRVARWYPFAFVDKVLAIRRWHDGNITGVESACFSDSLEGRVKVLNKIFSAPDLPEGILEIKEVAYFNLFMRAGINRLYVNSYRQALRDFWAALRSGRNLGITLLHMSALLTSEFFSHYRWGVYIVGQARKFRHLLENTIWKKL